MAPQSARWLVLIGTVACSSTSGSGDGTAVDSGAGSSSSDGGVAESGVDAGMLGESDAGSMSEGSTGNGEAGTAGGTSVTLGFIAGSAYSMYASVGGGPPHPVQLDTGSIGMYVPAADVGSTAVTTTTACSITYVSSGTTLSGHEVTAAVALLGSVKAGDVTPPPTTVAMTVCAVDDATFTGGMMGVGFGRSTTPDPTRNVLLQLAAIKAGTMRAGYVLSTHPSPSVELGITGTTGFQTVPLTPDPSGSGDWVAKSLRGCLALPATPSFGAPCGPLLVDTGVADTLLWGPADPTLGGVVPSGQTTVPAGVAMQITAEAGASVLDYVFTVGTAPDSPAAVSIRSGTAFSINTGRALLVDWDYLFDAQGGIVGFRKAM